MELMISARRAFFGEAEATPADDQRMPHMHLIEKKLRQAPEQQIVAKLAHAAHASRKNYVP